MSCPGGCINGGGQPYELDKNKVKSRMSALYKIDKEEKLRTSHNNPSIVRIYKEFLKEPLSKVSHKYLHTHYKKRNTKY
jgi:iron only hydrogenase large subunit-like protein